MTREELEQYQPLLREISYLTSKLNGIRNNPSSFYVADTVVGSTESNPMNRVITIHGIDWASYDRKVSRYADKLKVRLKKAEQIREEIEEFIDQIPDDDTRVIFQMRYLDNKKFHQIAIALRMGGESTPRMKHNRYLENYFSLCDCCEKSVLD